MMNEKRKALLDYSLFIYDVNADKFQGYDLATTLMIVLGGWADQTLKIGKTLSII